MRFGPSRTTFPAAPLRLVFEDAAQQVLGTLALPERLGALDSRIEPFDLLVAEPSEQ